MIFKLELLGIINIFIYNNTHLFMKNIIEKLREKNKQYNKTIY